jgi:hypothetical protein
LKPLKKYSDTQVHIIDGSNIRAHRHAAGSRKGQINEDLGRSCGGFSSKIHVKVDGKGMLLEILISRGEASDISQAERHINERRCENLLADRGYDSNKLRSNLKEQGIKSVIAGGINRKQTIE